jgi:glutamate dehydrogenase/leucine dehydrogenase
MPAATGFDLFHDHFNRPPSIVVDWHDTRSPARGWLCIDSLRGDAAGGGTRLRPGGTREEAVFLAKTMHTKFRVCGPDIGGGKSVLDYSPKDDADKRSVLERWYRHVGPYLKSCYGTGGDVGVDEVNDATACIEKAVGLQHPQAGIVHGHYGLGMSASGAVGPGAGSRDGETPALRIDRVRHGVEARVILEDLPGPRDGAWMVADVATGVGVVRAIERYYLTLGRPLEGQRAIIEGFGAVGAFAAYYLQRLGVKTIAASTAAPGGTGVRVASDPEGLDVNPLVRAVFAEGRTLPPAGHPAYRPGASVRDAPTGESIFAQRADIFIPAARSHTIDFSQIALLKQAGVKVWSCGANNPFWYDPSHADGYGGWVTQMLERMKAADPDFAIIPDFIANSGMARTFAYLMSAGSRADSSAILSDIRKSIDAAMDRLFDAGRPERGLIDQGLRAFLGD